MPEPPEPASLKYLERDGAGKPPGYEFDYVRPRIAAKHHIAQSLLDHGEPCAVHIYRFTKREAYER